MRNRKEVAVKIIRAVPKVYLNFSSGTDNQQLG